MDGDYHRMNQSKDAKETRPAIAVFGLGYVGCVTAACFAELGYRVTGVDVDTRKVKAIQDGQSPFYEPNLEPLIAKHLASGLLSATLSTADALRDADFAPKKRARTAIAARHVVQVARRPRA